MMDVPVTLTVNHRPVRAARSRLLIHVLTELGIRVPTLCHDDRLTPYGGCRLCVVERTDGAGELIPACSTRVQEGMIVLTDSPEVVASRQQQLQLLILNHRMECPVCDRNADCRLQDLVNEIGVPGDELTLDVEARPRDESSPVIIRDPGKCVVCGRCVRLCEEVQGVAALGFIGRGIDTRVTPFLERPLDCEFCGQCVNACPVGALVAEPYVTEVPAWQRQRVKTTCSFCACGCEVAVETHHGRLQQVTADLDNHHSQGKLCVKGWLGLDVVDRTDRLTAPLVRKKGALVETSWPQALAVAADGLRRAAGRGPVMVAGSGRLSCEDGYLLQAFAREVLGSPHIDCAPVGGAPALVDGVWSVYDRPRSTAGLDDLRCADLVLVVGSDPSRSHPLIKTELVQAAIQRNTPVIVAHPVATGLERQAAAVLRTTPGSNHCLLWAVARRAIEIDRDRLKSLEKIDGYGGWQESLAPYDPATAAQATGIAVEQIVDLADRLSRAERPLVVVGTATGVAGDEAETARAAAMLTATLGPTAGLIVLGGRSNVQGLVDVGCHPRLLGGHRTVDQAAEIERITGRTTVAEEGWNIARWASDSSIVASGILMVGVDPVDLLPRGLDPRRALDRAGFIVVADAFLTRTAERADVVLPAAILSEREGTTVGADGVRRPLRPALDPPAGARPDGAILIELARRMGATLPSGDELRDELDRVVGWGWGGLHVRSLQPAAPPQIASASAGYLLDAMPQLFHSGSVTTRSPLLQELSPTVAVRINPADARRLGVSRGEVVKVSSQLGEVLLRARLDRSVRQGTVVVPWVGSRDGASTLYGSIDDVVSVKVRRA